MNSISEARFQKQDRSFFSLYHFGMRRLNFYFTVGLFSFLFTGSAWAQDEGLHTRIHHQYQSVRALGMGDAFVALANDYAALMYNPAGLARREDHQVNLALGAGVSGSFNDFYKDAQDVETKAKDQNESDKFQTYFDFLNKYYGKSFQIRLPLMEGFWVAPNWGIGFVPMDLTVEYKIHNQALPALNIRAYADTTLAWGYGQHQKDWGLPGLFSWGVTGKFVNRGYANKVVNAASMSEPNAKLFTESDLREGYTVDADLGVLYSPEVPGEGFWSFLKLAKPTYGLVVRNVAETGFKQNLKLLNKTPGTEQPEKLYRVLDIGSKYEYPELWIFSGRGMLDFRDIGHPNISLERSVHVGFEFDWAISQYWKGAYRVGLSQGYYTAGLSAKLLFFNLDLATFAEDVGSRKVAEANRQYALKASMEF